MSALGSMCLCLTCLSQLEEGAILTEPLRTFLCDVLHFKSNLLQESQKIVCHKCYKTLIDLKCFYTQLRDVEVYIERKFEFNNANNLMDEGEAEEPYISEVECAVTISVDPSQDPIIIDEDDDEGLSVVEYDNSLIEKNTVDIATRRRFVCLTCRKFFTYFDDLRSHEKTHSRQLIRRASPVFLAAISQEPLRATCPYCGHEFYNKFSLSAHMNKHKRLKPFSCKSCKIEFVRKEHLFHHENKYECIVCHIKFCNRRALKVHIAHGHNWNMNGVRALLDSISIGKVLHQQNTNYLQHPEP